MLSPTRRLFSLVLAQLLLCWLETYLISKISLIGKIGIATFYKQYALLRSFWKTYLLLAFIQIVVILVLYLPGKRATKKTTNLVSSFLLITGLLGLVLTFQDFLHTYGHRLMKERFHLGFYIFWLGWMASCVYFLFSNRTAAFPADPNAPANDHPRLTASATLTSSATLTPAAGPAPEPGPHTSSAKEGV